jgi:uncharacterized protein YprB with RNaseH-like and TPR domain
MLKRWDNKLKMTKRYIFDLETLGLSPWHGRIICICLKDLENGEDMVFCGRDEKTLLQGFWGAVEPCCELVGFNSDEFDLPFLLKRSLIRDVPMKKLGKCIDLRKIVNGFWFSYKRDIKGTLKDWARVLHMPMQSSPGCEVWGEYKRGDWFLIVDHCLEDTRVTFELYKRCKESNLINFNHKI